MLGAVKAANGLAVLAHPARRDAWKSFDPSWADQLLGIEIWNRKYDGWAPSETAPALLKSTGAVPFVGLDFHTRRQSFPLAMALDIHGDVSEEAVVDSLRSRRCSARAFRHPLNESIVHSSIPVLKIAEQSRKMGASIIRYSRGVRK
jgi:hypothetical protein